MRLKLPRYTKESELTMAQARDRPKVSIHIISYNQQDFIAEALESALAQNYPNLEVIVSDDGSSDSTPAIVGDFASRHPDRLVALLNPDNLGITRNSNRGLRACTGEFISFMGGDDVLLPDKISRQVAWFGQNPRRVLCGHQLEVFYDDHSRAPHPFSAKLRQGRGASEFIREEAFGAVATMVRANAIPPWGFDERLPSISDLALWVDVLSGGGEYGFVDATLARYRKHAANVTNEGLRMAAEYQLHIELIAERHPQYCADCRYAYIHHVLYYQGVQLLRAGRKYEARARFAKALVARPLFLKSWARLAQSLA